MKAIALTGLRTLQRVDRPEPACAHPGDALLRVDSVGVCGSDIHYFARGRIGSQVVRYPFIVGHEFAATVLDVGRDVRHIAPGDRVAVDPAMPCGACDQCRANRRHTCRRLRFFGCPGQSEGCMCERVVLPASCCFAVPPDTDPDLAALAEPLSIGVYAVRLAEASAGMKAGILGAGPIGRCVLLAARSVGIDSCYITEPIRERRDAAMEAGAAWAGDPHAQAAHEEVAQQEPGMLDLVFECSGTQEALDDGIRLLKPGGRLMILGIPATERVTFDVDLMRHREIRLQNVRRQNECMPPALDLIARVPGEVGRLRTHVFPFDAAAEAFEQVESYRDGVVKAMMHFA